MSQTPLTIKTFDEIVTSPEYGQAEDKALYVSSSLAVTDQEKEQIQNATVGQANNPLWAAYRKNRITASNFGLVLNAVQPYSPSFFKTLLGQKNLSEVSAVKWGIEHEPTAKQEYTQKTQVMIHERGLFLSDRGLLGGSPDGAISDDCIIEVKCPYGSRDMTVQEAVKSKKLNYLDCDESTGSFTLQQNHNYWHQIQGNLYLTKASQCFLLVWTKRDLVTVTVHKDPNWEVNIGTLETFYKDIFLPKVLSQLN